MRVIKMKGPDLPKQMCIITHFPNILLLVEGAIEGLKDLFEYNPNPVMETVRFSKDSKKNILCIEAKDEINRQSYKTSHFHSILEYWSDELARGISDPYIRTYLSMNLLVFTVNEDYSVSDVKHFMDVKYDNITSKQVEFTIGVCVTGIDIDYHASMIVDRMRSFDSLIENSLNLPKIDNEEEYND